MKHIIERRLKARGPIGIAGLLLAAALAVPLTAYAAPTDGPYNIDGSVPDVTPATTELPDASGNVKELGPLNSNTTKIGVIHADAPPTLGLTNPNGQVDLRRAWLDTERDPVTGHDWLYFAWERDANSGSGFIAYEFMQDQPPTDCGSGSATVSQLTAACNPWDNRRAGDFMILWDQQGGSKDLYLRTWSGTGDNLTLGAPVKLDDSVSAAAYSADGYRGEAAVDLTATIFGGSTACRSFANTIPSTVTGNSDSADYKDTILTTTPPITNCSPTLVTTPKVVTDTSSDPDEIGNVPGGGASIGTGVLPVADSAVVGLTGGTATPAGSVSFWLCKVDSPGVCSSGGTPVGSTALSGSAYPVTVQSPTAYVTSAGRYCWRSSFSGDAANGIATTTESASTECFTVNPVTPTITTSAGPDKLLGQSVTDSATLAGAATEPATPVINLTGASGPAAGGTMTFKLYGPSSSECGDLAYTSTAVSVNGNGTYNTPAPQFAPTAEGDYHWVAVYDSGGSANNNNQTHNTACTDSDEDVTVTTVPSSMTTAQKWVPSDSATISAPAGGALDGTVSFKLYASSDCGVSGSDAPIYSTTRSVSGASPVTVRTTDAASQPAAQSTSGSFSWLVGYDSNKSAQRDIEPSCHETSALTISNGGTVSSD